jgi:hypothetical protein
MQTRAEIISALRHARQWAAEAREQMELNVVDSSAYFAAQAANYLWRGRIAAYEDVLNLPHGEEGK